MKRQKPSPEAEQQYQADLALAVRRGELLEAAREAENQFRKAQARRAPERESHCPGLAPSLALTDGRRGAFGARRAAVAPQRAAIGALGYGDRIYRRKAKATPKVHALTAEAEHLLTLRETHRLNGIPEVPFGFSPLASPVA